MRVMMADRKNPTPTNFNHTQSAITHNGEPAVGPILPQATVLPERVNDFETSLF